MPFFILFELFILQLKLTKLAQRYAAKLQQYGTDANRVN